MEPERGSRNTLLLQGQALTFLLLNHGEVWGSQGLWEHREALQCVNSKAKACPPELGQPLKD